MRNDSRWAVAAVLALAALLRFFHLDQDGYSTYYGAAVRSMLENWHNFVFASFDPAGFVTTDKPAGALWIQTASAWLFGFSRFSLCLPSALAGVLSTWLMYRLVAWAWGERAGIVAALFYAVVPITVAVDRGNLPDGLLVCFVLLAAWCLLRAVESERWLWLLGSAVCLGIGFNIKLVAAFLVLPAFAIAWLVSAPSPRAWRVAHLVAAGLVLGGVSLSWVSYVDSVPRDQRPFIESSADDSMLNTILVWDGMRRLPAAVQHLLPSETQAMMRGPQQLLVTASPSPSPEAQADSHAEERGQRGGDTGAAGAARLFRSEVAGQFFWCGAFTAVGLVLALTGLRGREPRHVAATVLWATWLLVVWWLYSNSRMIHRHYLNMLVPAVVALAAYGWSEAWRRWEERTPGRWLLVAAIIGTAAYGVAMIQPFSGLWSLQAMVVALALAALVALGCGTRGLGPARACAMLSALVGAAVWSGMTAFISAGGQFPLAGPALMVGRPWSLGENDRLERFLVEHQGNTRYLVAVSSGNEAALLIISTGRPVMAMGGFTGSTPILTPDDVARMVARNEVRYFMINSGGRHRGSWAPPPGADPQEEAAAEEGEGWGGGGRNNSMAPLVAWIRQHGKRVEAVLDDSSGRGAGWGHGRGRTMLYEVTSQPDDL